MFNVFSVFGYVVIDSVSLFSPKQKFGVLCGTEVIMLGMQMGMFRVIPFTWFPFLLTKWVFTVPYIPFRSWLLN
jgi:hypothetical protein